MGPGLGVLCMFGAVRLFRWSWFASWRAASMGAHHAMAGLRRERSKSSSICSNTH